MDLYETLGLCAIDAGIGGAIGASGGIG